MKYVYVLENELKFRKDIYEKLCKIDPQLQIRFFSDINTFSEWVNLVEAEGNKALGKGGVPFVDSSELVAYNEDDHLALLVSSNDILGSKNMSVLKKTHELFMKKGLCKPEEPTSVVITCFDEVDSEFAKLEDYIVNNVIFKPFDLMILEQHLNNALTGRKPPEENNLHYMKINANMEMLKNIQMEYISLLGFVSKSEQEIKVGAISKYYAKEFTSEKTRSVMAKCVGCVPHPENKEAFQVTLNFLGLEVSQIRDLRKTITVMKSGTIAPYNWNNAKYDGKKKLNVVVLDEKKQSLADSIQRNIKEAKAVEYNDWDSFVADMDPAKNVADAPAHFPQTVVYKLKLDRSGSFVLGSDPEVKPEEKIFGLSFEQLKPIDLVSCVSPEFKSEWQSIMRSSKPMPAGMSKIIALNINNEKRLVKVFQKEKVKNPEGGENIVLSLSDVSKEERANYLKANSKWPETVDLVLCTNEFYQKIIAEEIAIQAKFHLLSHKVLSDAEEKQFGEFFNEIFVVPYDRNYMTAKIKAELGLLLPEDLVSHKVTSRAQVANPVDVTEISEAGVVLKYSRALTVGSFRKFVLWTPSETELLEYTGNCNYVEAVEGEDPHVLNHFVFFGMRDLFLKNIRLWIRESYISSKDKTG